jgi:Fur family ferric uptake transcriptional regulator
MVAGGAGPGAPPARDWAAFLRQRGLRATPARLLVLDALAALGHGTPEELHEAIRNRAPGTSVSTVYRSLDSLAEQGAVSHTHLGLGSKSYQLAGGGEHAHLVCRACGRAEQADPEAVAALFARVRERHGFVPDPGHLSVFGLCGECAPRSR